MDRVITVFACVAAGLAVVAAGWVLLALWPRKSAPPRPKGRIAADELAPGVTAEVIAAAPSAGAPDQTVCVTRFAFKPGAEIFPHRCPGTTIFGVVSGTLGWTLKAGVAHVIRGAAAGATGPAVDLTRPGTDVLLMTGDAIYCEADAVHTARGVGRRDTVVIGSLVLKTGQPLLMKEEMAA